MRRPAPGDDELVARIRDGDPEAFDALHRRYRRLLERYAESILRSAALAEEVVQDAFLQAHRTIAADPRPLAVRPWLFRVVRNRALDLLRAQPPSGLSSAEALEHRPDPGARDPAARVIEREELRDILRDIAALPERQREVLLRRELEGASHREVAADLGITVLAAKSLVTRARESLEAGVRARDAHCDEVRAQLRRAHGLRRRAGGDVHRHLRSCPGCRAYRERLRSVRTALRILTPGPAIALAASGAGAGGGGLALKAVAATVVAGAVLGGGAVTFGPGEEQPYAVPAAGVLSAPLAAGSVVPERTAVVRRTLRPSARRVVRAALSCPGGMVVAGTAPQHEQPVSWGLDPAIAVGHDRVAVVRVARTERPSGSVAAVVLCKRPQADGSILATATAVAAAASNVRKVCVRRAYLFEAPGTATIGSVYRGQPVRVRRLARRRTWANVRTDAGVIGWVRASALCLGRR